MPGWEYGKNKVLILLFIFLLSNCANNYGNSNNENAVYRIFTLTIDNSSPQLHFAQYCLGISKDANCIITSEINLPAAVSQGLNNCVKLFKVARSQCNLTLTNTYGKTYDQSYRSSRVSEYFDFNVYIFKNDKYVALINNEIFNYIVYGKPRRSKTFAYNPSLGSNTNSNKAGKPRLYYDSFLNGMRECAYDPGSSGSCLKFKKFNSNSYNKNTLFYNKKTGAMQPCIGNVTVTGSCTMFGEYIIGQDNKNTLFYNPQTKRMVNCLFINVDGTCANYSITASPQRQQKQNPYQFSVPNTSGALIQRGLDLLNGNCRLGLNC